MPAKQTISVTRTRTRTRKSSSPTNTTRKATKTQKRCPTCGKYMK